MNGRKRIPIPENAAGRLAFDVFRSIAEKIWDNGNDATSNFAVTNFPDCKTVSKKFIKSKLQFQHIVKTSGGEFMTIIYDYVPQTISATRSTCEEVAEKEGEYHRQMVETFRNHRSNIVVCISAP